jgi:hypothetical protein
MWQADEGAENCAGQALMSDMRRSLAFALRGFIATLLSLVLLVLGVGKLAKDGLAFSDVGGFSRGKCIS